MSKIPSGFVRGSEEAQTGRGKLTSSASSLCFVKVAEGCRNRTYRRPTGLPPVLRNVRNLCTAVSSSDHA